VVVDVTLIPDWTASALPEELAVADLARPSCDARIGGYVVEVKRFGYIAGYPNFQFPSGNVPDSGLASAVNLNRLFWQIDCFSQLSHLDFGVLGWMRDQQKVLSEANRVLGEFIYPVIQPAQPLTDTPYLFTNAYPGAYPSIADGLQIQDFIAHSQIAPSILDWAFDRFLEMLEPERHSFRYTLRAKCRRALRSISKTIRRISCPTQSAGFCGCGWVCRIWFLLHGSHPPRTQSLASRDLCPGGAQV